MPRTPKRSGEIIDGPEHRPRERRPHIAQEVADLSKWGWAQIEEHIRRLRPCVRHRALGCKASDVPTFLTGLRTHVAPNDDKGYYNG